MGRRVRHSREFKLEAVRRWSLARSSASGASPFELGIRRNGLQLTKERAAWQQGREGLSRSGPHTGVGRERSRASEARA